VELPFREIWAVDFEFMSDPGDRPFPLCLVARELRTGRLIRQWRDEFGPKPPYPTDRNSLFLAYFASAELGCHLALGWPLPERVLDLYAEFRNKINGWPAPFGYGLPGAMRSHGLDGMAVEDKAAMRALILRGGHNVTERAAILDYCQADVDGLAALLPRMLSSITKSPQGPGRALLRGRFMGAVAKMEHVGIPVDRNMLDRLRQNWAAIKAELVAEIDRDYGVYDGAVFREARFADLLAGRGIPWPRLESGRLDLKDDTFREMARAHPEIAPLRELRHALGELRLTDLAVGHEGRNRVLISPFSSKTGRNQPSNSKYVFGPAVWLRSLIKPDPGRVLVYLDWRQQEVCVRRGAVKGPGPTRSRAIRRRVSLIRESRQAGAVGRNQGKPPERPRPMQGRRTRRELRDGRAGPSPTDRHVHSRRPGTAGTAP
jgi:DNA polymerase-1